MSEWPLKPYIVTLELKRKEEPDTTGSDTTQPIPSNCDLQKRLETCPCGCGYTLNVNTGTWESQ